MIGGAVQARIATTADLTIFPVAPAAALPSVATDVPTKGHVDQEIRKISYFFFWLTTGHRCRSRHRWQCAAPWLRCRRDPRSPDPGQRPIWRQPSQAAISVHSWALM